MTITEFLSQIQSTLFLPFRFFLCYSSIQMVCENEDSRSNPWRVIAQTSSNLRKLFSLSPKWPWRSRSIDPNFNRILKGPKIHILCENGDSRSNPWRVIVRTSSSYRRTDGRTDRQTDAGNDNTPSAILPRGKNGWDQPQLRPTRWRRKKTLIVNKLFFWK